MVSIKPPHYNSSNQLAIFKYYGPNKPGHQELKKISANNGYVDPIDFMDKASHLFLSTKGILKEEAPLLNIPPWQRPPITPTNGDKTWTFESLEQHKRETLKLSQKHGVLLPYGSSQNPYDQHKPILILIPGLTGNPHVMLEQAQYFSQQDYQVLFYVYEDKKLSVDKISKQLVSELSFLHQTYKQPATIHTISKSMGSLIVWATVRKSYNPNYLKLRWHKAHDSIKFSGFDKWHAVSIDGQLDGARRLGTQFPILSTIIKILAKSAGWRSALDLRSNSKMYRRLYRIPRYKIPGYQHMNLPTNQALHQLPTRSSNSMANKNNPESFSYKLQIKIANKLIRNIALMNEHNPTQRNTLLRIAKWIYGGNDYLPARIHHQSINFCLGLRDDQRITLLTTMFSHALHEVAIDPTAPGQTKSAKIKICRILKDTYQKAMPPYNGDHLSFENPLQANNSIHALLNSME